MKKILSLLVLTVFLFSCNSNESKLNEKIKHLESENFKLKHLLDKNDYNKIVETQLILQPQSLLFKLNNKNRITGIFCQQQNYPKFELYLADNEFKFKKEDKIDLINFDGYQFEFDYIPKKLNDERVNVVALFDMDTVKVNLNGRTDLPVKDK